MLIISAGTTAYLNKKILSHKILVGIGLISYPLYLWHWPLLSFCRILQGELLPPQEWLFIRIVCIILAFILAVLSYCYIEKPIRFGKNNKNKIAGILLVMMMSCFAAGVYVCYKGKTINKYNTEIEIPPAKDDTILEYAPEANFLGRVRFQNAHSDKTIAVIGDSHAQSAFPGIAQKCAKLGYNTVLFNYKYNYRDGDEEASEKAREFVINILQAKTDIKSVFIFLRGILYLQGKDIDIKEFHSAFFTKNFQSKLQKTVDTLRSFGKHVFIVTENPVFPFTPQDFFHKFKFTTNSREEAWISKESVYEHQKEYLQMLNKIKGAEIINGLDVFCPHDKCSMFDENGNSLYYDDDHLSIYGSHYLTENLLAPYLEKIAEEYALQK